MEAAVADPRPVVRDARPADAGRIVRFQQAMALETEAKTLDAARVVAGVDAVLASRDLGFYIVAEMDDSVVGSMLITYEWSDWRNGTFWWIQSVFVEAGYRRIGVYTAMHEFVLRRASAHGDICGIRLYVERANDVAQQTYRRLGMDHSHYDLYETDFQL